MEDGKVEKNTVRIGDCRTQEESDKLTEEEITETTFHRTCRIRRGTLERAGSDSFEEDSFEEDTKQKTNYPFGIWSAKIKRCRETSKSWRRSLRWSGAAQEQVLIQLHQLNLS